jgi:hypothetical protein
MKPQFWRSLGVWGAINSDAGDVAQLVHSLPSGKYELSRRYEMSEPRWSSASVRRTLPADLSGAPPGGALMYWYVRDRSCTRKPDRQRKRIFPEHLTHMNRSRPILLEPAGDRDPRRTQACSTGSGTCRRHRPRRLLPSRRRWRSGPG